VITTEETKPQEVRGHQPQMLQEQPSEGRKGDTLLGLKEEAMWHVCPMQKLLQYTNLEIRLQQ
jgi:hypothetical protein